MQIGNAYQVRLDRMTIEKSKHLFIVTSTEAGTGYDSWRTMLKGRLYEYRPDGSAIYVREWSAWDNNTKDLLGRVHNTLLEVIVPSEIDQSTRNIPEMTKLDYLWIGR